MNFGRLLNDQGPPLGDEQPEPEQLAPRRSSLQHILGQSALQGVVEQPHEAVPGPSINGQAAQAARAPHFSPYGLHELTAAVSRSTGPTEASPVGGAFDMLSQAAQHALDPASADAYMAQLNQPTFDAADGHSTALSYQPPALPIVNSAPTTRRRSIPRGSQLSPSSSVKVVPDSDEDVDAEGEMVATSPPVEDGEDVTMQEPSERSGSERAASRSVNAEDLKASLSFLGDRSKPKPQASGSSRQRKTPAKPKTTRAQRKANKVKAGKARAALYGNNVKPTVETSPAPSSSAKKATKERQATKEPSEELALVEEEEEEEEAAKEEEKEAPPEPEAPLASTSNLTSLAPSPAPSVQAPPLVARIRPPKTVVATGNLSAPFDLYAPPRGSDSEEDDFIKAWQHRRKGKGRVRVAVQGQEYGEEEEEDEERLYCVCQKHYDPDRIMIACDKCENWYHLDCVEISNDKVELVDQFICPNCHDVDTGTITTWKSRCARPTCRKAVAPLSKYCSDYCGIEVAATRLDLCGIDAEYFWPRVVGARRREAHVFDMAKVDSLPLQTDPDSRVNNSLLDEEAVRREEEEEVRRLRSLEQKLAELLRRREVLDGHLSLVDARSKYLGIAIRRWEALCQATAETLAAEKEQAEREAAEAEENEEEEEEAEDSESNSPAPKSTKSKVKAKSKAKQQRGSRRVAQGGSGPTSLPEAQCGLDVRLVFDAQQWKEWVNSDEGKEVLAMAEGEGSINMDEQDMERVCLMPRKRCDRHTGWQKVREADFDIEKSVITRRLERLALQEGRLRAQVADLEEHNKFRAFYRHRIGTVVALPVDREMQALAQLTPDEKVARRLLLKSLHNPIPAPVEPVDEAKQQQEQGDGTPGEGRETPLTMEEVMAALVTEAEQTEKEREKERRLTQRRLDRERARAARDRAIEKEALAREAAEAQRELDRQMAQASAAKDASPELGAPAAGRRDSYSVPDELYPYLSRSEQLKRRSRR